MSQTEHLRQQHSELITLSEQFSTQLDARSIARDPTAVRVLLSTLAGKLIAHLMQEDRNLYSGLMQSKDRGVRELAARDMIQMGRLVTDFARFLSRWANTTIIQQHAEDFVEESRALLKSLIQRVRQEADELYPVADKVINAVSQQ